MGAHTHTQSRAHAYICTRGNTYAEEESSTADALRLLLRPVYLPKLRVEEGAKDDVHEHGFPLSARMCACITTCTYTVRNPNG